MDAVASTNHKTVPLGVSLEAMDKMFGVTDESKPSHGEVVGAGNAATATEIQVDGKPSPQQQSEKVA